MFKMFKKKPVRIRRLPPLEIVSEMEDEDWVYVIPEHNEIMLFHKSELYSHFMVKTKDMIGGM